MNVTTKNTRTARLALLAIAALAFGFGLTACDSPNGPEGGDDNGGDRDLVGTVSISPSGPVGLNQMLTANYDGDEPGLSYQWKKDTVEIPDATNAKYTPTTPGSYTVTVSKSGYKPKTSDPVTVTDDSGLDDLEGDITITPNTDVFVNTELTASYDGDEPGITYQWNNAAGPIVNATSQTYTPTTAGSYTVTVSKSGYNPKTSTAVTLSVKHTVTFDPQNGDAITTVEVEGGQTVTKPAEPRKDGYVFDDW